MPDQELTRAEIIDNLLDLEVCDVFLDIVDGNLIAIRFHDFGGKGVFVIKANSLWADDHAFLSVSIADQAAEDERIDKEISCQRDQ